MVFGPIKTAAAASGQLSARIVTLPLQGVELLRYQRTVQDTLRAKAKSAGRPWIDEGHVFTSNTDGRRLRPSLVSQNWKRIRERSDIDASDVVLHGLRHTRDAAAPGRHPRESGSGETRPRPGAVHESLLARYPGNGGSDRRSPCRCSTAARSAGVRTTRDDGQRRGTLGGLGCTFRVYHTQK